jgi:cytochrome c5
MKKYIFAFASASLLVACAPKVVVEQEIIQINSDSELSPTDNNPVSPQENKTIDSDEKIVEGKKLFYDNCGKCHDLYQPSQFSKAQWGKIVPEMAKKAELKAEQGNQILLFVQYGAMN